jgi:hypothetical protein
MIIMFFGSKYRTDKYFCLNFWRLKHDYKIFQDGHIHIEGLDLNQKIFKQLIANARTFCIENLKYKAQLLAQTNQQFISSLVQNRTYMPREDSPTLTFGKFLSSLFTAKAVLSSTYDNTQNFIELACQQLFRSVEGIRLGITPTLPYYFDHLRPSCWFDSIVDGLCKVHGLYHKRYLEIVLETKREDLCSLFFEDYIQNIQKFIKDVNQKLPTVRVSLSISGNEAKYPLSEKLILDRFEKYLEILAKFSNVSVSLHTLEAVSKQLQNRTLELDTLLEVLDQKNIFGVNFIHISNLYTDQDRAIQYLHKLKNRDDRIIICPSSNRKLGNPLLLQNPHFIESVLDLDLNVILGSDDPNVFGIESVFSEIWVLKKLFKRERLETKLQNKILNHLSMKSFLVWDFTKYRWYNYLENL